MEFCFPFDAVENELGEPDRVFDSEDWARNFELFFKNGIFPNPSTNLQVLSINANMVVTVSKGSGYINGRTYINSEPLEIALTTANANYNRKDTIILRLDLTQRHIKVMYKQGVASGNPVPVALVRNSDVWDLKLAEITVRSGTQRINQSDIVDTRLSAECGVVTGAVTTVDVSTLWAQYQSALAIAMQEMKDNQAAFLLWFEGFKAMYDAALEQRINDFDAWFNANKTGIFDAKYFDFDNAVYRAGHTATTVKRADGSYLESIINTLSRAIYATRETTKQADGAWVSHVICHKHNVDITEITRKVNGVWESVVEYTGSALAVGSFKVGEALVGGGSVARSIERIIPEKTDWIDYQTPVDAENMNKIEGSLQTLDVDKVSRGNIKVDAGTF